MSNDIKIGPFQRKSAELIIKFDNDVTKSINQKKNLQTLLYETTLNHQLSLLHQYI